jgi:hypothetical protein
MQVFEINCNLSKVSACNPMLKMKQIIFLKKKIKKQKIRRRGMG